MGAGVCELRNVRLNIGRGAIKLAVVKQARALKPRFESGRHYIECVLHPVYVTDLIAIVGWDRKFPDRQACYHQLDDDLGVEMKILRIAVERNCRESLCRVNPIS